MLFRSSETSTRRAFLRGAATAAPAAALLGTGARADGPAAARGERRVLAGPPDRPFSRAVVLDRTVVVKELVVAGARVEIDCVAAL